MGETGSEVSVESLRSELEEAYDTIGRLSEALEGSVSAVEKLSEGGPNLSREDVLGEGKEPEDPYPCSPYVDADGVSKMLGCSKPMAYKHMRAAGAATFGHRLIAKRVAMQKYAEERGIAVAR